MEITDLNTVRLEQSEQADSGRIVENLDEDLIDLNEVLKVELRNLRPENTDATDHQKLSETFRQLERASLKALCLSGGGIRSATFALGVVQALAKHKLLDKFDYLSTVSGGGYLGAWLSAWIYRECESDANKSDASTRLENRSLADSGVKRVQEQINYSIDETEINNPSAEPVQLRHLRDYSNYMSPSLGLLSADTWTLIGIYLRNLFLNWTIFLPLISAVLLLPRLLFGLTFNLAEGSISSRLFFGLFIMGLLVGCSSVAYVAGRLPSKRLAEIESDDSEPWVLAFGVAPLVIFAYVSVSLWALHIQMSGITEHFAFLPSPFDNSFSYFVLFAAAFFTVGYLLYFVTHLILRFADIRKESLILNWKAILISLFASINGGAIAWLIQHNLPNLASVEERFGKTVSDLAPLLFQCFGVPIFLLCFLISATVFIGLSSRIMNDEDREWLARFGAWILIVSASWLVLNAVVLIGPVLIDLLVNLNFKELGGKLIAVVVAIAGLVSGIVSLGGGFSGAAPVTGRQSVTKLSLFLSYAPRVASVVFLAFIFVTIAYLAALVFHFGLPAVSSHFPGLSYEIAGSRSVPLNVLREVSLPVLLLSLIVLLVVGFVMALFVNVNKFSLHGGYRDRLVRAYLGASNLNRRPDKFTGFDESDNLQLHCLNRQKPLHVINATLNLVGGKKLAWKQRKAGSFTMTAFHCGSWITGYRPTNKYSRNLNLEPCKNLSQCNQQNSRLVPGERDNKCANLECCKLPGKSLRLGTAMAISGAAANPNMGYYSSGVVTFLMSLFNIRLGWWLGNPGRVERVFENGELKSIKPSVDFWGVPFWTKSSPSIAVLPLINETLGRTDGEKRYVNITDGGHFENLALYEMLLRRCKFILVSDAAADAEFKFGEISNAIRKCKVDLGVDINFKDGIDIFGRGGEVDEKTQKMRHALAEVTFPETADSKSEKGVLVYIRPTFYGDESTEIQNYADTHPLFPHQSTGDQFYDEQQFEAYRSLGFATMEEVISETTLEKLLQP